ncbi:MAG: MerR family transcriptional regulator [Beijerinckiaceae bacterium]
MTTDKAADAFRTISEAADELGLEQHVLRFWETRFAQIKPLKRGGGRRYYRPDDVDFLRGLKFLLHEQRYTIKGVQKIIKEQGMKAVIAAGRGLAAIPPPTVPSPVRRVTATVAQPVVRPVLQPVAVAAGASPKERLEAALAELMAAKETLAAV